MFVFVRRRRTKTNITITFQSLMDLARRPFSYRLDHFENPRQNSGISNGRFELITYFHEGMQR